MEIYSLEDEELICMAKKKSWDQKYEVIECLGEGGNGKVYHVKEISTGKEFALKQLNGHSEEKRDRFIDEIKVAKENSAIIPGILPILDVNEEEYWYTMPVATPIMNYVKNRKIEDIIQKVLSLSETLEKLHEKGISHRDIKPSNIYFYNKRFFLSDFGLVSFSNKEKNHTKSDRALGAIFTIAPEMKRDPKHADGKKADVFSFAKTVWMLLAEDEKGFDGCYNYLDSSHSLHHMEKFRETHLVELDELLLDSTNNTPELRPTMRKFRERLEEWFTISKNLNQSQASEWKFLTKQLFGKYVPKTSEWTNIDEIVDILNVVGSVRAYNHMFFSGEGGLDFHTAELANEEGCIYLYDELGRCHLVKPKALFYETFGEYYHWNYFLLELNELDQQLKESNGLEYEVLVEDFPSHYVDGKDYIYGVYDYTSGEPLPKESKLVYRYMRGKLLITMKLGPYNRISDTYDGRHGQCSHLKFREYIEELIKRYSCYCRLIKNKESWNIPDNSLEELYFSIRKNPFQKKEQKKLSNMNSKNDTERKERLQQYVEKNYTSWNFKEILEFEKDGGEPIQFYFQISTPNMFSFDISFSESFNCLCKDGSIKKLNPSHDTDCYYIYNRTKAIQLKDKIQQKVEEILKINGFEDIDRCQASFSIDFLRRGKPVHLFTRKEIGQEIKNADDRVSNQLTIDEYGYVKVTRNEGYGKLYPIRFEQWDAGNRYVGKYADLSMLNVIYLAALDGWLSYLETGRKQYIDYYYKELNEEELIKKIKKYY